MRIHTHVQQAVHQLDSAAEQEHAYDYWDPSPVPVQVAKRRDGRRRVKGRRQAIILLAELISSCQDRLSGADRARDDIDQRSPYQLEGAHERELPRRTLQDYRRAIDLPYALQKVNC